MSSSHFRFQNFTIQQDQCAMKVGIDSIVLAALTEVENEPKHILDIGSGTGILSLMMAQKNPEACVIGVELEPQAVQQSRVNISNSPYGNIEIKSESIQHFALSCHTHFDLIISNPPYYNLTRFKRPISEKRTLARHSQALGYLDLLRCVKQIMAKSGHFSVIIPASETKNLKGLLPALTLHITKEINIVSKQGKQPNRVVLFIRHDKQAYKTRTLCIRDSDGGFTPEFIELTKPFYGKPLG